MDKKKVYLAIDLKSFYASAECVARGLDPLTTNLLVADESRTEKTICLAVSPSLKSYGIPGRCRLFEAQQTVKKANQNRLRKAPNHKFTSSSFDINVLNNSPETEISFITATPRMSYYMDVSARIYGIYLRFVAPEDIFSYSVDEVFIDATGYLTRDHMTPYEFASLLVKTVFDETSITATCGIGTNLYLAKIAMDIEAKHVMADKYGTRIAELDEYTYRSKLWDHKPLSDFWRIGSKTAKKLEDHGIYTMGDIARVSVNNQAFLYKMFGIDAEIMIDHAWGVDNCTIKQVKDFEPESNSICDGQVLSEPYSNEKARIIVQEMADNIMFQLVSSNLVTDLITLDIGYDRENCDKGIYKGKAKMDHYGRNVPPPSHGSIRLDNPTNLSSQIIKGALEVFDRISSKELSIRRLTVTAGNVTKDTGVIQFDMFTDVEKLHNEKDLQNALVKIKKKYGNNAILKGTNLKEGATMQKRNKQIRGHNA